MKDKGGLVNEAVRFVLELCLVAVAAWWGWRLGKTVGASVTLALLFPIILCFVWAALAAPRRPYRTPSWFPSVLFLVLVALAVGALVDAGHLTLALVFGTVCVVNELLLRVGVRSIDRTAPPG